ncbi:MAG: B12-binding domain-containing radical SAM protein [Candidatus Korarchaeum sp.]|nr:B12-binding domain-containing radical SAM protein [Candidatus Korarchaeum sp.]MDW8034866.1 radical SAM protein [Candidatus Korarchaeum sp.]
MRVALVIPPARSSLKEVLGVNGIPLGLAYLASIAREEGYEVNIFDFSSLNSDLDSSRSLLKGFDPDVIGISSTTPATYDAYEIARISKELNENAIVIVGGPHTTFLPTYTLRNCPFIDVVVRGEGEESFRESLRALERSDLDLRSLREVRGISYREPSGEIRHNPPRQVVSELDYLPMPAYDLIDWHLYEIGKLRYGVVMTSRGCPFNCIFCSSSLQFGKIWRAHSVSRVIEELRILREDFRVREIEFLDDTFTLNRRRAREICESIVREGIDLSWSASSRVNTFDRETVEAMKKAGAHTVYFGIESGTQKVLDFIGKGIRLSQAADAVKLAAKYGLKALGSFVIGFPIETREDIERTISFAKKLNVDYAQFTVATPYPGTRLWNFAIKNKLLATLNWRLYTTVNVVMRSLYMTMNQIQSMLVKAYLTFYLRPRYLVNDLLKFRGSLVRRALPTILRSLWSFIKGGSKDLFEECLDATELIEEDLLDARNI